MLVYALRGICDQYQRTHAPLPIILWVTKSSALISQTMNALESNENVGGLLSGLPREVRRLQELDENLLGQADTALIALASYASFHRNEEKGRKVLRAHKGSKSGGSAEQVQVSIWNALKAAGRGDRALLVVYDESHNFSPNQTETLGELKPDGYLLSSGTASLFTEKRYSQFYNEVISPAASILECHYKTQREKLLVTTIDSKDAVNAGLVKEEVHLHLTETHMEYCVDKALATLRELEADCKRLKLDVQPKAIYVCKTNITDSGGKDSKGAALKDRNARSIALWKYLAGKKGIKKEQIAVYANVVIDAGQLPAEHLYKGSNKDFNRFQRGDYRHVIFNQALQEGWDDPNCYVAYIDKTMKSSVQIKQVIGRLLRQPGGARYNTSRLNAAHFFVRVAGQSSFAKVIGEVKEEVNRSGIIPKGNFHVHLDKSPADGDGSPRILKPRKACDVSIRKLQVDAENVERRVNKRMLASIRAIVLEGAYSTEAEATQQTTIFKVADGSQEETPRRSRVRKPPSTQYSIYEIIRDLGRTHDSHFSDILIKVSSQTPDILYSHLIGLHSPAHKELERQFKECAETYYQNAIIRVGPEDQLIHFPPVQSSHRGERFSHSLFEEYSDLNKLELPFAESLDRHLGQHPGLALAWHRNTVGKGFYLPVLSSEKRRFYPDFLIWKKPPQQSGGEKYTVPSLVAVDTKGDHLIDGAAKDLHVSGDKGEAIKIFTRLVSRGNGEHKKAEGFSVWSTSSEGKTRHEHHEVLDDAIDSLLQSTLLSGS